MGTRPNGTAGMFQNSNTGGVPIDRRTVIRGITAAGLSAGGLATLSGSATADPRRDCDIVVDDNGNADYSSIQVAEAAAQSGQTICVKPGTYEESVTVTTEDLTIRSWAHRNSVDVIGQTTSVFSIDADGVTLDGLSAHNPGRLLGIKVESDHEGVTVANNRVSDLGPTSTLGVSGIIADEPQTDLTITGNRVEELHQTGYDWPSTTNGIFLDDTGGGGVQNVDITDNRVRDLTSEQGTHAILVNANATNTTIAGNRVRDISASNPQNADWAQGIGLSDETSDITVEHNEVRKISSETYPGTAIKVEAETTADNLIIRRNDLIAPVGVENANVDEVVAECNYWGHPSGPYNSDENPDGKGSRAYENPGDIDFTPWSRNRINRNRSRDSCDGGRSSAGSRGRGRGRGRGNGRGR